MVLSIQYRLLICFLLLQTPFAVAQSADSLEEPAHISLVEMGTQAFARAQFTSALHYFDQAINQYDTSAASKEVLELCQMMSATHQALGNYRNALIFQQRAGRLKVEIANKETQHRIDALGNTLQAELAHAELLSLKKERRNTIAIIIMLVLLVVLIGVMATLIVVRNKAKAALAQQQRNILEDSIRMKTEAERVLKAELDFKVRELTSFTLHLIQKKEMLFGLKMQIEEIRSKVDDESKHKLARILAAINLSQRQDKDWENFKIYFEQVHHGFLDRLLEIYPDLNSNDLKLCALIKLNLDTRQIASVLDIAPESAKVAKHRIRKKLGIAHPEELQIFFSNLDNANISRPLHHVPVEQLMR